MRPSRKSSQDGEISKRRVPTTTRRSESGVRIPLLLFLAFAPTGCLQPPDTRESVYPWAPALLAKGAADEARGETEKAEDAYRLAVAKSPGFVEGHRALQNLLEKNYRGHEAVEMYRLLLDKHPAEAGFHYLLARLTRDPAEQARLFRRALELDPNGYWPNLGMGFSLFQDRSFGTARIYFSRALRSRPRAALAWRFLGEALAADHRLPEALEALRMASRFEPDDTSHPLRSAQILLFTGHEEKAFAILLGLLGAGPEPSAAVRSLLRKILRDEEDGSKLERAWKKEEKNLGAFPDSPPVLAFAGYLALMSGKFDQAASLLARALKKGAPPSRPILDLRLARFGQGRYGDGLRVWERRVTAAAWDLKDSENRRRYEALVRDVEKAESSPEDASVLLALGRSLLDFGWVGEAICVLGKTADLGHAEAPAPLACGRAHDRFVRGLRIFLNGEYRRFLEDDDAGDLNSLLAGISRLSLAILGLDLGAGNPVRSFFLVGEILGSSGEGESPLLRYFESFNQYLILGRRAGGTPEAVLMTVVYRNRIQRFNHAGEVVRCDFVIGEDFALESYGEYLGGALLGVTLMGRFYTNLDEAIDRDFENWNGFLEANRRRDALKAFKSWRAQSIDEALSLDAGYGLKESLLLASFGVVAVGEEKSPALPAAARAASRGVIDHELMHVRDANRYLPIRHHPVAALGLGLRHGFSKTSIEASMEERAALVALLLSERPHLELMHILAFAPYPESRLPHSRGYCRLMRRFLETLYNLEEEFPAVDRRRNLCRQLHLLSADEIRAVARILAEEEGILR